MPTYDVLPGCWLDYRQLDLDARKEFMAKVQLFIHALSEEPVIFPNELRIHKLKGLEYWSMTWAPDGRAVFIWGDEVIPGERHVIWIGVGSHKVYS